MRTTAALAIVATAASILGGVLATPPGGGAGELPLRAAGEGGLPPAFDGRLYADPESGCFHLEPPDDGRWEATFEVEVVPDGGGHGLLVQLDDPADPLPDRSGSDARVERGPWPLCEHPEVTVDVRQGRD